MQPTEPHFSQPRQTAVRLTPFERIALTGLAVALILVLGIASGLTPDSSGIGTHRQLGLPPCTMKYVVGIRCMGCGMTTAWAHTLNGDWQLALASNATGFVLCILSLIAVPVLIAYAMSAKVAKIKIVSIVLQRLLIGIIAICVAEWVIRLALG